MNEARHDETKHAPFDTADSTPCSKTRALTSSPRGPTTALTSNWRIRISRNPPGC